MRRIQRSALPMSLDDVLQLAREQRALGDRLKELLARRHSVNVDAQAEIDAVLADDSPSAKAYRLLGKQQHKTDAKKIAHTKLRELEPLLSRALFEGRHHHGRLAQTLREFIEAQRQPPALEDVILKISGEPGWSIDRMLAARLLEQVTVANLRDELRATPPSGRLAMHERASLLPDDPVNSIILRVLETETISYPANAGTETETAAALMLGRRMQEAQAARVPEEVNEVRAILEDVEGVLTSAERSGVVPINPAHPPALATDDHELAEGAGQ